MSTKKKPASKSAADKGPQPLLKLKFEKFPDKPVAVYFETTKLCFYADFGFEQYESPSVPGLKQKIQAAIKRGVTPSPVWAPMIQISISTDAGRTGYKHAVDFGFDVSIERNYFCIGKGGKLVYCGWEVHENRRNKDARETYGTLAELKPRFLDEPIFKRDKDFGQQGNHGVDALLPYTEALWKNIAADVQSLRVSAADLISQIVAGKMDAFYDLQILPGGMGRSKPAAKKPTPKRAPSPRTPNTPLFPLHEAAKKSVVVGSLSKDVLPHANFKLLDLVIDLPPGPVPAELLAAAGFPADTTARKESSGDFWVNSPGTGQVKCVPRAEMQKLIRDRINGQRGAKPQEVKKPSPKKKAKKHNGDTTAREHLVVKYQGKQLTLGQGPLGNYLVEALRKTYPSIHSAYCLKDNSVQISLQGVAEPRTITAADFERLINHPSPQFREPLHGQHGDGVSGTPGPGFRIAALNGAIAKLHELVDAMQPEDPPLVIPGLILLAAGFPESASADMHSPDEIIVRVPKKAPQFLTLAAFEERIRERIPAETPHAASEKELVGA